MSHEQKDNLPGGEGLDLEAFALTQQIDFLYRNGSTGAGFEETYRAIARLRSQVSGGEGAPADSEELATCLGCGKVGVPVKTWTPPGPDAEPDEYCAECGSPDIFDTPEEAVQAAAKELSKLAPAVPDALTWTREKPKLPGLYWFRLDATGDLMPVHLFADEMGVLFEPGEYEDEIMYLADFNDNAAWAGPIPDPREAPPAPGLKLGPGEKHCPKCGLPTRQPDLCLQCWVAEPMAPSPVTPTLGKE
jgi:hypothetical protein